jgi:hypothetical protein
MTLVNLEFVSKFLSFEKRVLLCVLNKMLHKNFCRQIPAWADRVLIPVSLWDYCASRMSALLCSQPCLYRNMSKSAEKNRTCSTHWGVLRNAYKFQAGNLNGRNLCEIILKKSGVRVWIESNWPRTGPIGGFLWTRLWTLGFHQSWGICWPCGRLSASQDGLCSAEYVLKISFSSIQRHSFLLSIAVTCLTCILFKMYPVRISEGNILSWLRLFVDIQFLWARNGQMRPHKYLIWPPMMLIYY